VRDAPAKSEIKETKNINLDFVNDMLWQDERTSGAFQCDKDTFMATSKVMLRNLERSGLSIMLVLATFAEVGGTDRDDPPPKASVTSTFSVFGGSAKKPEVIRPKEKTAQSDADMSDTIEEARKKFVYSFRRGDIVCLWNPTQILIMLTNLTFEDAETAMERINKKIQAEILRDKYTLDYKIIPLEHEII